MHPVAIVAPGITLAHTATSNSEPIPRNAAGKPPAFVRVACTTAAYVRLAGGGGASLSSRLGAGDATITAAGVDYEVGDTITLAGGTFTDAVVIEVETVDTGGEILTVSIADAGVYTAIPANPVAQGSTSGAGTGATFDLDFGVVDVVIADGGSGYVTAPDIVFAGANSVPAEATATLTAGVITSVAVDVAGEGYAAPPTVTAEGLATAVAGDMLVQPGDAVLLACGGSGVIATIRVTADGVTQVSPVEEVIR